MSTKKTTPAPTHPPAFLELAWDNIWGVADDTRSALHKQALAFISLVDGAAQGAISYLTMLTDRSDTLAHESILAGNRAGRELATNSQKLISASRERAGKILGAGYGSARQAADRASASARALLTPAATAA